MLLTRNNVLRLGLGLALGLLSLQAEAAELRKIKASGTPLTESFSAVGEGDVVALDLALPSDRDLAVQFAGAEEAEPANCLFGTLEPLQDALEIPTGDNHFLLTIRLGDPGRHAANLASCEYRPGENGPESFVRLRGCFLALSLSIPTAHHLLLHPLPARDCREAK